MKDYGRIITKIGSTPWLMTPEGLNLVMSIVDRHLHGHEISEDELSAIKLSAEGRGNGSGTTSNMDGIGVLPIHGPIFGKANLMTEMSGATSLETFQADFRAMMDDPNISSILLDVDSPGGTSDLVNEVGAEILAARGNKPINAIANTQAGSAAFWLATQADKFYVTPSGMVGSLGAFTVHTDQSGQDAQDGLKYTFISAGPNKTEGNPHEALTSEALAYRQGVIDELYTGFVEAVANGRNMSTDKVIKDFGGGRMVTPNNAVIMGMVDGIRTFDQVVSEIQSEPQPVKVSFATGGVINASNLLATMDNNGLVISTEDLKTYMGESKEWEHSAAGEGSPPPPRIDQDGHDDKAIVNRWRREDPAESDHHISPSPPPPNSNLNANKGGEMETVQEQLYKLLGVTTDDALLTKITDMHTEQSALLAAVHASTEEARLAEDFPMFWGEHQARVEKERKRDAKEFVKDISMFTRTEGEGKPQIETGFGISALVMDEVQAFHLNLSQGKASLAEFEEVMKMIAHGGIVDYKEHGSARPKTSEVGVYDTSTPVGLKGARDAFAQVVSAVQEEMPELSMGAAVAEAAKREPELAQQYRQANPGKA